MLKDSLYSRLFAGAHIERSIHGAGAPKPEGVAAFQADCEACWATPFTGSRQVATCCRASMLAYNARCNVGSEMLGYPAAAIAARGCIL